MKITKPSKKVKIFLLFVFFFGISLIFLSWGIDQASADDLWNRQVGMDTKQGEVGAAFGEQGSRDSVRDIRIVVANIIRVFLGFMGIILTLLIIYGGFLWMTASGNSDQVTKAKGVLIRSIIGLVIVLAAFAIATFVINAVSESVRGSGDVSARYLKNHLYL